MPESNYNVGATFTIAIGHKGTEGLLNDIETEQSTWDDEDTLADACDSVCKALGDLGIRALNSETPEFQAKLTLDLEIDEYNDISDIPASYADGPDAVIIGPDWGNADEAPEHYGWRFQIFVPLMEKDAFIATMWSISELVRITTETHEQPIQTREDIQLSEGMAFTLAIGNLGRPNMTAFASHAPEIKWMVDGCTLDNFLIVPHRNLIGAQVLRDMAVLGRDHMTDSTFSAIVSRHAEYPFAATRKNKACDVVQMRHYATDRILYRASNGDLGKILDEMVGTLTLPDSKGHEALLDKLGMADQWCSDQGDALRYMAQVGPDMLGNKGPIPNKHFIATLHDEPVFGLDASGGIIAAFSGEDPDFGNYYTITNAGHFASDLPAIAPLLLLDCVDMIAADPDNLPPELKSHTFSNGAEEFYKRLSQLDLVNINPSF